MEFNNVINKLQKKAYSTKAKVEILNNFANQLSNLTDLATEIYISYF